MSSLNKVMLIGRLNAAPKTFGTVVKFKVATEGGTKDSRKTEWHSIVAFGAVAEICGKFLEKGSLVYVDGRLDTSSYDKDGVKTYSTSIIANSVQFLTPRDKLGDKSDGKQSTQPIRSDSAKLSDKSFDDMISEPFDMPF